MGSCNYFMRLEFETPAAAKKGRTFVAKFQKEMKKAYDYWQDNRGKDAKVFYAEFEVQFPLAAEYLKKALGDLWGLDCNNGPSGYMDFGEGAEDIVPGCAECEVFYFGVEVWHGSDWGPIIEYLKEKTGALDSAWGNEEHGHDWTDAIQVHDWKRLMQVILSSRESLPPLIGLNPELDVLIERALKGRKNKGRISSGPSV